MNINEVESINLGLLNVRRETFDGKSYWRFFPFNTHNAKLGLYPYNLRFEVLDQAFEEYENYKRRMKFQANSILMKNENLHYDYRRYLVLDVKDDSVETLGIYDLDERGPDGSCAGSPGGESVVFIPIPTKKSVDNCWHIKNGTLPVTDKCTVHEQGDGTCKHCRGED